MGLIDSMDLYVAWHQGAAILDTCGACKQAVRPGEPMYLVRRRTIALCRHCFMDYPACPTCGEHLGRKKPKQKGTCPHCACTYYVRSTQPLFGSDILSESQLAELEALGPCAIGQFSRTEITHHYTSIAGVTRKNADGTRRQKLIANCVRGERLLLESEENNKYDPHAIIVLTLDGIQLGYLKRGFARPLSVLSKKGFRFGVHVLHVGASEGCPLGCQILILAAPPGTSNEEVQAYLEAIPTEELNAWHDEDNPDFFIPWDDFD